MTFTTQHVSWNRGGNLVVNDISLALQPGETIGLLGPNGSGKSSFLSLLASVNSPTSGRILLNDDELHSISRKDRARQIGVVSQHANTDLAIPVIDVVRLGRIPHRSILGTPNAADEVAVDKAIAAAGLGDLVDRDWHHLSGGEQQRVHIARALAQEPQELLLDEPTNHLDIKYQLELMELVSGLPVTSVIALHDLNLAAMYCDHVIVMKQGKVVSAGRPSEVLTAKLIYEVYGVRAEVHIGEADSRPRITYLRNARIL